MEPQLCSGSGGGASYQIKFHSDSDEPDDLNKVFIQENIVVDPSKQIGSAKEIFKRGGPGLGEETLGDNPKVKDHHVFGPPLARVPARTVADERKGLANLYKAIIDQLGQGTAILDQYFIFWDTRTGMKKTDAVKVTKSGFKIQYDYKKLGGSYLFVVTKTPNANNDVQQGIMPAAAQNAVVEEVKP